MQTKHTDDREKVYCTTKLKVRRVWSGGADEDEAKDENTGDGLEEESGVINLTRNTEEDKM